MTDHDYGAPKRYSAATYRVRLNRKRQIIDATLAELHEMQFDMIDQAVELSDFKQARDVIDYIRSL